MGLIANTLCTCPRIEKASSARDKWRLKFHVINLRVLFDDFDVAAVPQRDLPSGPWSSRSPTS